MALRLQADVRGPKVLGTRRRSQVRVSFSGLDGAGKSSQIQALVANLAKEERATEVLWLPYKYWPNGLKIAVPMRFRRKLHPRNEDEVVKVKRAEDGARAPHENGSSKVARETFRDRAVDGLRTSAWAVTGTLAAVSAGISLRRRMAANTAEVLVLDRYRLDTLVKLRWAFPAMPQSWLAGIVRAVAPAPDLEVLCRVDPEVAYARKADQWNVGQLAIHARLYDELASSSPAVLTLDAARNPDDIARDVFAHLRPLLDERLDER